MNEWWLLSGFLVLLIFGLTIALYPLRKSCVASILLVPLLMSLVGFSYWRWGAWSEWTGYLQETKKQHRAQKMLKSVHDPAELITQLKDRLTAHPEQARGWYLLGRLYVSQNQWKNACDAFAKAHELEPANTQTSINYAQSLWQQNQQKFNSKIDILLKTVLNNDAHQPDALAMLAMDAFQRGDYQHAIEYWEHLLTLAPPQSSDAKAIRKAIAKARQLQQRL